MISEISKSLESEKNNFPHYSRFTFLITPMYEMPTGEIIITENFLENSTGVFVVKGFNRGDCIKKTKDFMSYVEDYFNE